MELFENILAHRPDRGREKLVSPPDAIRIWTRVRTAQ